MGKGIPTRVDTSQITSLGRDLLKVPLVARRAARDALVVSAEAVRTDAISRVNSWPRKQAPRGTARTGRQRQGRGIAGSIRVQKVSDTTVRVVAGGAQAPEAAPIENRGRGYVRHPTFGHRDRMTSKNSHPAFLAPAMARFRAASELAIDKAVTTAIKRTIRGR